MQSIAISAEPYSCNHFPSHHVHIAFTYAIKVGTRALQAGNRLFRNTDTDPTAGVGLRKIGQLGTSHLTWQRARGPHL